MRPTLPISTDRRGTSNNLQMCFVSCQLINFKQNWNALPVLSTIQCTHCTISSLIFMANPSLVPFENESANSCPRSVNNSESIQ